MRPYTSLYIYEYRSVSNAVVPRVTSNNWTVVPPRGGVHDSPADVAARTLCCSFGHRIQYSGDSHDVARSHRQCEVLIDASHSTVYSLANAVWRVVRPSCRSNLQNDLLGLDPVGFWPYFAATLPGILPGALLYSYLGAAGGATIVVARVASAGGCEAHDRFLYRLVIITVSISP